MNDKESIRKSILDLRRKLDPLVKAQADMAITETLLKTLEILGPEVVCIYSSFRDEVDTSVSRKKLEDLGVKLIIPPQNPKKLIDVSGVDVVVAPIVAFDPDSLYRAGFGGGYYDRILEGIRILKIGLAYEIQIVDDLPYEPHDVPMDMVITEKNIYRREN